MRIFFLWGVYKLYITSIIHICWNSFIRLVNKYDRKPVRTCLQIQTHIYRCFATVRPGCFFRNDGFDPGTFTVFLELIWIKDDPSQRERTCVQQTRNIRESIWIRRQEQDKAAMNLEVREQYYLVTCTIMWSRAILETLEMLLDQNHNSWRSNQHVRLRNIDKHE